jgi:hypothetical protein
MLAVIFLGLVLPVLDVPVGSRRRVQHPGIGRRCTAGLVAGGTPRTPDDPPYPDALATVA